MMSEDLSQKMNSTPMNLLTTNKAQVSMPSIHERYFTIEKIGNGTYGNVYKAFDKTSGEIIALKQMKKFFEKENMSGLIMREIAILKELDHFVPSDKLNAIMYLKNFDFRKK